MQPLHRTSRTICVAVWRIGFSLRAIFALSLSVMYGTVLCQPFPTKPVRIVTAEAGGASDFVARLLAQGLSRSLGQQVIVENRGGASGIIAAETVARAAPDGYTLLLYSNGMWTLPLMQKVPYDSVKDFLPITAATRAPNILVVHPSLPVRSVKDLVRLAKLRPGELNYASGGSGTTPHLAAELFNVMASVHMVRVAYRGGGPALNDLFAGQVQVMFPAASSMAPHVKTGRVRALAVTGSQPTNMFPDLPTVSAAGLPGYEAVSMTGIFAPAQTPASLIALLNQEIVLVLEKSEVKGKLMNVGVEVVGASPAQFASIMKTETERLGKVIKAAGIKAD
jgi:tripartite-type tricarboxylate transporter receptor subunit TctC